MTTTHLTISPMRHNEIGLCAELSVQAFADYEYFTNFFTDRDERLTFMRAMIHSEYRATRLCFFTNSESNLAFYRHLGFEVSDFQELDCRGTKMGSWSIVYEIPQQQ